MKLTLFFLLLSALVSLAKTVEYHLTLAEQEMNITGEVVTAMTINGGIPGPVLRFTEGDTAVMLVTNNMSHSSSVHWHGLLVSPGMDGVPFISFPPIQPGTTFTYRFPIRQTGTYWYHSHSGLQEQKGIFGGIVILPKQKKHGEDRDHVVMLSDWTNDNPREILRNLRRGSEFFGVSKKTAQSLLGAIKTGKVGEYFSREAMRMPPMDLADVSYDAFLVNGKPENTLAARPGEVVRLRVIDGAASTFFHLSYAGGPMTIVSADGQAVKPVQMKKPLLIGVAETYDLIIPVPATGAYEFRATAHDGSGYTSLWIGSGERHPVRDLPGPFVYDTMMGLILKNLFAFTPAGTMGMPGRDVNAGKFDQPGMNMDMPRGMNMERPMGKEMDMGMGMGMDADKKMKRSPSMPEKMDHDSGVQPNPPAWYDFLLREDAARAPYLATDSMMSKERPFAPYRMLQSLQRTAYDASAPRRDIRLTLDGDMNRYVWSLNNQPIHPRNNIYVREGEVVRFIMINRTMMHHPMHLHGHFFRVINGQGDRSPLKHTVDVEPMTTTVIEFLADERGYWFFHCHLLYHMMSGMARVVKYEGFTPSPEVQALRHGIFEESNPWFFYGHADLLSSQTQGDLTFSDPLNIISLKWEAGWQDVDGLEWEGDLTYSRYFNRFAQVFAGVYAEGVDSAVGDERFIAGFRYLLPGNFMSQVWIDDDGEARVTLEREMMLTPRLGIFGEGEYDTREDWSWQAGLSYDLTRYVSATALWDSSYGVGAGLTVRF